MEKYFLTLKLTENYTAGSKAKIDAEYFLYQSGFKKLDLYEGRTKIHKLTSVFKKLRDLPLNKGKVIIVTHYPLLNPVALKIFIQALELRRCDITLIGIIHDVNSLRYQQNENAVQREIQFLNMFDFLISHNSAMTKWLVEQGFKGKIQELELFDYKIDGNKNIVKSEINRTEGELKENRYIITFAGNLDPQKSGFIYSLENVNFSNLFFYLYGPNFVSNQISEKNIIYKGVYESNLLPLYLEGNWGLIWDGDSVKTCSGALGNYLKYNSPHKLSLYIVAGLPVIIWSKAAAAELVKKYKIGIVIDSLEEIPVKLESISNEEYQNYRENVMILANKLKKGEFIIGAVNKIINSVEEV